MVVASASQSPLPPRPLLSVIVTLDPAMTVDAFTVSTGGESMAIVSGFEVPPPGEEVNTVTTADPAVAISAALTDACSCVALTNVVVRGEPFHLITERLTNLVPFTVSVNAGPVAITLAGESDAATGVTASVGSTVTEGLVVTRVLFTNKRNSYVPAAVGITTVQLREVTPAPTYVQPIYVESPEPTGASASQSVDPPAPFVSTTVTESPGATTGPAVSDSCGGGLIANVSAALVPPPGAGVVPLTSALPTAATSAAEIAAVSVVVFT